jgi:CRISPR associated protein Cas1
VKKLLNTVYVTSEGASLRKDGENLVAEVDAVERARVPFHMMSSVVVFGAIFVSPPLMQAFASLGITMVLLDRAGRFQARIEGPVSGNVLLRRAQYRVSENPGDIVRSIVSAKVANQRAVLQRALRDYSAEMAADQRERIDAAVDRLAQILRRVAFANDGVDVMRGAEGAGAWIETLRQPCRRSACWVASFTGAWIETLRPTSPRRRGPSPPSRGRGSKLAVHGAFGRERRRLLHGGVDRNVHARPPRDRAEVASFTGAWIETPSRSFLKSRSASPPSRGRGSKLP